MSEEMRSELRDDMQEVYRDRERVGRRDRPRPLSQEERAKLREELLETNRTLPRKRAEKKLSGRPER